MLELAGIMGTGLLWAGSHCPRSFHISMRFLELKLVGKTVEGIRTIIWEKLPFLSILPKKLLFRGDFQ